MSYTPGNYTKSVQSPTSYTPTTYKPTTTYTANTTVPVVGQVNVSATVGTTSTSSTQQAKPTYGGYVPQSYNAAKPTTPISINTTPQAATQTYASKYQVSSYTAQSLSSPTSGTSNSSPYKAYTPQANIAPAENLTGYSENHRAEADQGKKLHKVSLKANPKKYDDLAAYLDRTGETFRDLDFPPTIACLAGNNKRKLKTWAKYVWRSPEEFYGPGKYSVFTSEKIVDPVLAEKREKEIKIGLEGVNIKECLPGYDPVKAVEYMRGIDASDIKQRALGDCYFLSTLAAIAEYQHRILRLFPSPDASPNGCYMVYVCDMGEWKEIIVDDLFPCKTPTSDPVFTVGNDNELWVLLLEKAWAKIYGSYAGIEAGLTRESLHDLTGAPTEYFNLQPDVRENEEVWAALCYGDKARYIMTAGSDDLSGDGKDTLNSSGLVGSHAYSLLSCHPVKTPKGEKRLVKLRNPWGKGEWKGEWSDGDTKNWTPQLKKDLEIVDVDDGEFHMEWSDFCKYFSDVQVCRVHDDYKYSSHRISVQPKHATFVRFTIPEDGLYYFTVNQKSKRFFDAGYQYADVCLIVGKEGNNEYEYIEGNKKADREVWTNINKVIKKGTYVAYIKCAWHDNQTHDAVFSVYGSSEVKDYKTVPKTSCPQFLEKVYTNKAETSGKLTTYEKEGEPNAFRFAELTDDGFGYFFFWNKGEAVLNSEIFFKVKSGVNLRKPYSGNSFKVSVKPGEKKIVLTKVSFFTSANQSIQEKATFERSAEDLIRIAKQNGQREQRVLTGTNQPVDINLYNYKHATGAHIVIENRTNQYVLDETIKFKFNNVKIEDKPYDTSVKFTLAPGQVKEIKLKKCADNWGYELSSTYTVRNA